LTPNINPLFGWRVIVTEVHLFFSVAFPPLRIIGLAKRIQRSTASHRLSSEIRWLQPRLRLALDAHVTLAFAASSVINIKSGRQVELKQRTIGRRLWSSGDATSDPSWPILVSESVELRPDQPGRRDGTRPDTRRLGRRAPIL
jgi:hypothetical protein